MAVLVPRRKSFKFVERLKKVCCRNYSVDERLTTVARKNVDSGTLADQKENDIDMIAATYILQNYLDSQNIK